MSDPATQNKHDANLVKSLRDTARRLDKRSAKLGILLRMAADRIDDLSRDLDRQPVSGPQADIQPASTPIN